MDLRKIRKTRISTNPKNNKIDYLGSQYEYHKISEETDGLETEYLDDIQSNHCGCFGPPGGRCGECSAISCLRCHNHCGGTDNPAPFSCGVPLCRECSKYLQLPNGKTIALCSSCYGKVNRKRIWNKVGRMLAAPTIEFEDKNESKRSSK
ncbi:MAG: hypothetical protein A2Y10_08345 [Planctomycetes bacterium GWF2_41_51]|nr:MAG: hypothetical protein A2Y10_08345 [Planctomycetes bacterium GWF2_41_51]HBG25840.1 hypothetical protein [Phycisphaerales bacterium]